MITDEHQPCLQGMFPSCITTCSAVGEPNTTVISQIWYVYNLELEFDHSETDSELFDDMDMKLEAIASMSGMSGIFKLMAADVYKVKSLKPLGS